MKKLLLLALLTVTVIQFCYAITEEDKAAIRAEIDEVYSVGYWGNDAPRQAKDKAKLYVYNQYFYTFQDCRAKCESECDKIRAKANYFSVFTNQEAIQREASEAYTSCYEKNCSYIKDVQMKECYDFINEYIEYKNKNRKK